MRRRSGWLLVLATLAGLVGLACHREVPPPLSGPRIDERAILLQKIASLAELAPCLADAGSEPLRLVDAELAGEAATATFACTNGAAKGRVTFFSVAGNWMISTKEIQRGR
jgi:hypothetical protein